MHESINNKRNRNYNNRLQFIITEVGVSNVIWLLLWEHVRHADERMPFLYLLYRGFLWMAGSLLCAPYLPLD
jgi:hypothetical protein